MLVFFLLITEVILYTYIAQSNTNETLLLLLLLLISTEFQNKTAN